MSLPLDLLLEQLLEKQEDKPASLWVSGFYEKIAAFVPIVGPEGVYKSPHIRREGDGFIRFNICLRG